MLRVVPHRSDGVAVVVAHSAGRPEHFIVATQLLHKLVHQAAVRGCLFIIVVVVLVAGHRHAWGNAEWVRFVGIVGNQAGGQESVGFRRVFLGLEGCLPRQVKSVGVGSEVMIERDVLLKDDYDMLDRRLCRGTATLLCVCGVNGQQRHGRRSHDRHRFSEAMKHVGFSPWDSLF